MKAFKDVQAKKIYNPVTKKYYSVKERITNSGNKGEIKGLWSSKSKKFSTINKEDDLSDDNKK